ncbi:MAG: hypothetical protein SGPRY_003435, partial [Prymnesium sp.]
MLPNVERSTNHSWIGWKREETLSGQRKNIPDSSGNVPPVVVQANLETEYATEICSAVLQHGGPCRTTNSPFELAQLHPLSWPSRVVKAQCTSCAITPHSYRYRGREITWDQCTLVDERTGKGFHEADRV